MKDYEMALIHHQQVSPKPMTTMNEEYILITEMLAELDRLDEALAYGKLVEKLLNQSE